jgi:mycothiol synthase
MHAAGFTQFTTEMTEGLARSVLPGGFFVIEHLESGELAATCIAKHNPSEVHPNSGELGWVAALPRHRGRGLGQAVCAAGVRRFLDAGYERIFLLTDDHRLPAIKTYLRLGFEPYLLAPDMPGRWRAVCRKVGREFTPTAWPRQTEVPPEPAETGEREDADSLGRYRNRYRWHPHRPHRGHSGPGDTDAMGDESLYHPSRLGTARVAPSSVQAGSRHPLRFEFEAGPDGLTEGSQVTFVIRGQSPLGYRPRQPMSVVGPVRCEVEGKRHGFALKTGELHPGETVTCKVPPFDWTPLAGQRECKVVISTAEGGPEKRLPEPLIVEVLPLGADHLEATLPCTFRPKVKPQLHVTARDIHDNRAPLNATIRLQGAADEQAVPMVGGMAKTRLTAPEKTVTRIKARCDEISGAAATNPSIRNDELQLYVGDLHCHDFLSEAEGYTDEVYRWAIEERNLDFISVVPQTHGYHDNETWTIVKYMNERYLDEGSFVSFLGFEWQHTGFGDKVIHYLGGDQPYLPVDDTRYNTPAKLYEALRGSDALVISHHPAYPPGSWCSSTDFNCLETDVERLVELWSMHGSSEGYDPDRPSVPGADESRQVMPALRNGLRLGFVAGSDTHSGRPGGSEKEPRPHWGGLVAVWAPALTRRDVFSALRSRHTYALTRARIVLKMTVNGALMGSEVPAADTACIRVDAYAPAPITQVDIVKNTRSLQVFEPARDECHIEYEDAMNGPAFYHCRLTLADGNLAVCSPVWIG